MNNIPQSTEQQVSWNNPFAYLYSFVKEPLNRVGQLFTGSTTTKTVTINNNSPLARLTDEVFLHVLEYTIDPQKFFKKDCKDIFATCRGARALLPKYLARHGEVIPQILDKVDYELDSIPKGLRAEVTVALANITSLTLRPTSVLNFKYFKRTLFTISLCPKLKSLHVYIASQHEVKEYINACASCPQIQSLSFSVVEAWKTIEGDNLEKLGSLSHLKALNFSGFAKINDHKYLGLLPQLEELQIRAEFLKQAAIPQFNNLRKLTLTQGDVQDKDLAALKRRPRLETLIVKAEFFGTGAFLGGAVAYQNSLERLEFENAEHLDDAALLHLGKFENLDSFSLYRNKHVTGVGIAALQTCKNLTCLELQECSAVTTLAGIASLSSLRRLVLYHMPALCDASFECLNSLSQLLTLEISGVGINVTEKQIQEISKIKSLTFIEISGWRTTSAHALRPLAALPKLQKIWVTCFNYAIGDLVSVLQTYPALRHLIIDGTLNEDQRKAIFTQLPKLQKLEARVIQAL